MNTRAFFDAGGFLGEGAALADKRKDNSRMMTNAGGKLGQTKASQASAWRTKAMGLAKLQPAQSHQIGALLQEVQQQAPGAPYHAISAGFLMGWAYGVVAHGSDVHGDDLAEQVTAAKAHATALSPSNTSWGAATIQQKFQAQINEYSLDNMRNHWASHTRTLMTQFAGSLR